MSLLRTFIAVEIPHHMQETIQQKTEPLRKSIGSSIVRWTSPQNIHLTLKFLGDVSATSVEILTQMLRSQADSCPAFYIQISGLGYESDDYGFSPHLTLGRVKQNSSTGDQQKIRKALEETKVDSLGTARVDSVHLYKSDLKPSGSVYTKLFSAPLRSVVTT